MGVDRELAVSVALRLLDEHGLEKLTLRRIAAELNVQAPALYWHFANKRALLDYLTDAMLAGELARLGEPRGVWWEWLESAAHALRRALLAHQDGARVASGADLNRAASLGLLLNSCIEVLHGAGFDYPSAGRGASALLWFVIGRTVEEQSPPSDEDVRELVEAQRLPALVQAIREGYGKAGSAEETFAYSLGIMLTGLRTLQDG
ncbi:TetR family transcriptional regulator [Amycolatopsis acidicola]|uniref:TetR family transcriptional regulator n=1 Tax=Amycolatopsis acidicola TaxID=2596893 RepID=A0A5N0VIL4_9PSEU|nr:TetR/AcrR family transcriptional regulator C-terminal domain-containing protein [Amycolatopsis acidicola]KAA9166096.1 TetR family transcriptional regulator [Amycolatopsis acidicola]